MQKTVVINVVGLTPGLIGEYTPFLKKWSEQGTTSYIIPPIPAVTCTSQSTFLTGKWPTDHGIVGNGWYFKDECEIKFWRQSNKLVQATKVWEMAKKEDPEFTCANMFWWYNMYSSVDYSATPRPNYLADGRKLSDVYSHPADLRDKLQKALGTFPLFDFWGPKTSIKSSQWIAEASKMTDREYDPTLTLIYLPHLDYNLQRYGLDFSIISKDLQDIDKVCEDLVGYYESHGANVIILSEYGITNVNHPISINRILKENGFIAIREERGLELLDAGASKAFAVADHQLAHVYVNDPNDISKVRAILEKVDGIALVLGKEEKAQYHIDHPRAGDLVVVADAASWFTYYYWLDDKKAPDFARIVDIHRKPGYDPVEMFTDPDIKFLLGKVGFILLKKQLGFRYLMDVIPLKPELIKGSHGRLPESPEHGPLIITPNKQLEMDKTIEATKVLDIVLSQLRSRK